MADKDLGGGVFLEKSRHRMKGASTIDIVAVEVGDNVASRLQETLVDSVRLPEIGLRDPAQVRIFAQDA